MPPKLVPDLLLAKSFDNSAQSQEKFKGSYTLVGHTADVVNAVTTLLDILGDRMMAQFNLNCTLDQLQATARLAAYLHDWGKANHHFQGVVRSNMSDASPRRYPQHTSQIFRHEIVSLFFAWEFREWLQQHPEADFYIALAAAGGHHLKLGGKKGQQTDQVGELRQSGEDQLGLYMSHRQFKGLLRYGVYKIGLPRQIRLSHALPSVWTVQQLQQQQRAIKRYFRDNPPDPVMTAVIKALLVAGDAIGSALPPLAVSIPQWIQEEVNCTLQESDLERVITARLQGKKLRAFQIRLASHPNRVTLARAGCGTGKTLGAYNWAKRHAIARKLFFCYPTTGTSTEGFIDYVHNQTDSALLHSRANVDLERWEAEHRQREIQQLQATGEEEEAGNDGEQSYNEMATKLEAFKGWGKKSLVCTVDTVLGLLQCNRRPLYNFPAIAQGAFIFDEIHCYDDALFNALLRFLETVKSPTLLMSASILPWQKQAIEDAVGEPVAVVEGPKEIETQPRYRFQLQDKPDWQRVEAELRRGGKVLWVCNQVNTAIAIYQEAQKRGLKALLYHSRYRYQDRVNHHRAVVDAFKQEQAVLAITTQVAEMSLDLSATLLVSQIADPAGLVQRLGRLNRQYCGYPLDALFYPDEKVGYPYSKTDLASGQQLIETFTGDVTQAALAQWLEATEWRELNPSQMVLLDQQWRTYSAPLRQAGHNITAVLEQDLDTIESLPAKDLPRYTVPLPAHSAKGWKERYKFYPVAPGSRWWYSEELGAFDLAKENA